MTKNKKKQIPFPLFTRSPKKKKKQLGEKYKTNQREKKRKERRSR
jgi:hypothetical protein